MWFECGLILTTWSDTMSEHSDLEDCFTSNLGDLSISCSDPCTTTSTAATDTGVNKPLSILSVLRAPRLGKKEENCI